MRRRAGRPRSQSSPRGAKAWNSARSTGKRCAPCRSTTPGTQTTAVNLRELHDALDEKFHRQGGIRHLYRLFPGGPVAQGCRIAGLKAPAGATDKGFGSVA